MYIEFRDYGFRDAGVLFRASGFEAIGIMEKKVATTISGFRFRVEGL